MKCKNLCGGDLDARGFCVKCQAAEVRCPRCQAVIKAGPADDFINWQVCRHCLRAVADGSPALIRGGTDGERGL